MKKLMRKKLALMLATLKKKRKYFCEVEYLESTGYETINTGVFFDTNKDMRYQVKATSLSTSRAIIASSYRSASYSAYGLEFGGSSQRGAIRVFYNTSGNSTSEYTESLPINVPRTIDCNYVADSSKIYFSYDGNTPVEYSVQKGSLEAYDSIRLFLDWRTSPSAIRNPIRIYYFKIIKDNVLVSDLIPVLDWDKVPCMYDKVSGQLLYNSGTGDFSYGREIHPVEYILGTGTQYFDSGVATSTSIITECTCQYNEAVTYITSVIFGSGTTTDVNSDRYQAIFSTAGRAYSARLDGGTRVLSNLSVMEKRTVKVDPINKRFYVDDRDDVLGYSGSLNSNNIYFFVRNMDSGQTMADPTNMFFYCAKMWNDTLLIRDFIPAVDENGVAFAFDKVEHTIHDNIGTGAFEYPDVELEYLESDGNQYIETNFTPTNDSGMDITYAYPEIGSQASGICGTYKGTSPRQDTLFVTTSSGTTNSSLYLFHRGVSLNTEIIPEENVFYNGKINWLNDGKLNFNNGTLSADVGTNEVISQTIRLFSRYNDADGTWSNAVARIKSARLSESLNVSMDFIPVYHNGVACMYDKVSQGYFVNGGTGTFAGKIKEKR